MDSRVRPIVPLLAVAGLLLAAAGPGAQIFARDGKAQAIEQGHLAIEELVARAEANAAANAALLPLPGAECSGGMAAIYPCENVDLLSIVPIPEIGAAVGSDVWGWTDPESGREIALPTTTLGLAFVDVTDPSAPVVLGRYEQLSQNEIDIGVLWRDVKVYEDHAFLVSEHASGNLEIFDLTKLRDVTSDQGTISSDVTYEEFGNAHNIAINEETGFAYAVGTDTCGNDEDDGGLHMIDIRDPKNPTFAGCFGEDGYTHDVQCVIYKGLDTRYQGSEICFASNEDTLTIVDVTDKSNPVMLSRNEYPEASYTHQGWITPDHQWFAFGDELDEQGGAVEATATYVMRVHDLENPGEINHHLHDTPSIDHNMYFADGYLWQANYMAGLQVMDYSDEGLASGELSQAAFFDVDPGPDVSEFAGAWTAYPFFESGTIALNSFDSGLFLLRANVPEKAEEQPPFSPGGDDEPAPAPEPEEEPAGSALPATGGGLALVGLALVGVAVAGRRFTGRG